MEFDKSKVYTAANADEVKIGSKVICADTLDSLKNKVNEEDDITEVREILRESNERRFRTEFSGLWPLVYLISEPEEKKLKWTDLKIGDVIRNKKSTHHFMVIGIDMREESKAHIYNGITWFDEYDLEYYWEKVE